MSELSITVSIAGRTYPLTVKGDEHALILKAAGMINDKVKEYEETYSVRDKQDLLAMCALQLATHNLALEKRPSPPAEELVGKLAEMDTLLSGYLDDRK